MKPEARRVVHVSLLVLLALTLGYVVTNRRLAQAIEDMIFHSDHSGVPASGLREAGSRASATPGSILSSEDEKTAPACPLMASPFVLRTSHKPGLHGPDGAFDKSNGPDSFWEVLGAYPFWLQIEYRSARTVTSYSIQTGEEVTRMPTDWLLQGREHGTGWVVLDSRNDQSGWTSDEIRHFAVSEPRKHKSYRLFFTGGLDEILLRIYEISFHVSDHGPDFVIRPEGTLEWTDRLRISRSSDQSLPDLEDGRKRAQSGGTLIIRPEGDWRRNAIDLIPTNGKLPDVDALAEITLHRIAPSPEGFEMVSFAALATEDIPFGIIVEAGGKGKPRPFVFWTLLENTEFTEVIYSEAFRITPDGAVQFGRKRGKGSAARLLSDDPRLNDQRPVDALFIEKQDPADSGLYDSNYLKIVAKSKENGKTQRHEWRMNVRLDPRSGDSALVVRSHKDEHPYAEKVAIRHNGDVELFTNGGAVIMRSPNGKRWNITVDNSGKLGTSFAN